MNSVRIERNGAGFTVRVDDPKIREANRAEKADWKDPTREFNFNDWKQVTGFLDKTIDIALPAEDYSSSFDKAAKEVMENE